MTLRSYLTHKETSLKALNLEHWKLVSLILQNMGEIKGESWLTKDGENWLNKIIDAESSQ